MGRYRSSTSPVMKVISARWSASRAGGAAGTQPPSLKAISASSARWRASACCAGDIPPCAARITDELLAGGRRSLPTSDMSPVR